MERLKKIGKIAVLSSKEVPFSRLGIGFEKLDRAVFDPNKAYDLVGALGVKKIRLQSGWARTEKEKGVYDFSWLNEIVDELLSRGLEPWICLCYGNPLYDERAAKVFGAVGCPPIFSEEQKTAWHNYVVALVGEFSDRVKMWEIWNEPDGRWCWKHGPSASEYAAFSVDTAKAVREADPDAYVIGGAVTYRSINYIAEAMACGLGEVADGLSFHEYTAREETVFERVRAFRALAREYNPKIEIIQGESGSQSRSDGCGALVGGSWTPRRQAKQLLRHEIADMMTDVKFSSYFSAIDMIEALNGSVDNKASYLDYGYFGVIGAEFDENGFSTGTYAPKPSYYALQNVAALFAGDVVPTELPVMQMPSHSPRLFHPDLGGCSLISGGFVRPENGAKAFAYWFPADLMTTDFESTVTFEVAVKNLDTEKLRLVDPMDGSVYTVPDTIMKPAANGTVLRFEHLPVRDYPLFLTFGDFVGVTEE